MNRSSLARNFAIGATVVLSVAITWAADDLPKAETLLDKYVEATGGKAAYEKHHSEISKSTMEAMGMKGSVTSYLAEPDKSYSEIDLAGIGKMRDGTDGKVYWSLSSMMGPHIKEGGEKAQAMTMERLNSELHWREMFKDATTTGVDTVDGKECWKVMLTPAEGAPLTQCFDKQSGLMVKMSVTAQGPFGEQAADFFPTDYRKEDGVLIPHKVKQSAMGQEITLTIDNVSFNPEIPKDRFDLPDEIKALVNKK
jgi:hypothetical protein